MKQIGQPGGEVWVAVRRWYVSVGVRGISESGKRVVGLGVWLVGTVGAVGFGDADLVVGGFASLW